MQLTKNISLDEVVPKSILDRYGDKAVRKMNGQIITGAQWIIDRHGIQKVYINTWKWGGKRTQSGLRIPGHYYYRNGFGAHDNGAALDLKIHREDLENIHADAIENPYLYQQNGIWRIESIELATSWLHIDCVYRPEQKGVVFIDLKNRYTNLEYKQLVKNTL